MLKVNLINGKSFTVKTMHFAKGTTTTRIYRPKGRDMFLANGYIVSTSPCG